MVQLIAAAAIGGVAYVAFNSFKKHWNEIQERERVEAGSSKEVGELKRDPKTGRYKATISSNSDTQD